MGETKSQLSYLSDPRLAPYALGAIPVWLWSADATRVLWGNPVAAAIFNAASPAALAGHTIDPKGSAALQIARLAGTLPHGSATRLERLRGFGGRFGGALMCACSRIAVGGQMPAILVIATEAAGPKLDLAEQARRLLAGIDEPVAIFTGDGAPLHATAAAQARMGRAITLADLHAMPFAATALAAGRAEGEVQDGRIVLERIGSGAATVLLATLPQAAEEPAKPALEIVAAPVTPPAAPPEASEPVAPPAPAEPPVRAPEPPSPAVSPAGENREPAKSATVVSVPRPPDTRRKLLRFVWQMDTSGRFTINSDAFIKLLGPQTAAHLGRPWSEIATELSLDPEGQVARAIASQETWSGVTIAFPVDGSDIRLPAEMSGLPIFDRDRNMRGYRGFGVCRDVARMAEVMELREAPTEPAPPPPSRAEPPVFREEAPPAPSPSQNVVPFPTAPQPEGSPALTPVERKAFSELASRLSARLRTAETAERGERPAAPPEDAAPLAPEPPPRDEKPVRIAAAPSIQPAMAGEQRPILDRLPVGLLVYRLDKLIYANRAFLDWTGYQDLHALEDAGGLDALFVEPAADEQGAANNSKALTIATNNGSQMPVKARLFTSPWEGESALVLMLTNAGDGQQESIEANLKAARAGVEELRAVLDTTLDAIVVIDREGQILSINRSGEKLFGYQSRELSGLSFADLFARDGQRVAIDALARGTEAGRDVIGRRRDGAELPLSLTLAPVTGIADRFCAVFRDLSPWRKTESDLLKARRQAESASAAKSDFLAKISHEIRTPLNSIIGFAEVMMQERFGPIGNERYKQYLQDIHASGGHVVSLLNDLLDLSKIEAGKLEMHFADINLNQLTQQCVTLMQPQANRERIIIRTSLPHDLPQVTVDERSVRQIVLNLLSNSIKFTGPGGQVIVSTALNDEHDVVLRVRDTGVGMSEKDLEVALEPFRQLATSTRWGSGGTGLGLPISKALAEANRARFRIRSAVNSGTLVEVAFPAPRMAAE